MRITAIEAAGGINGLVLRQHIAVTYGATAMTRVGGVMISTQGRGRVVTTGSGDASTLGVDVGASQGRPSTSAEA